MPRKLTVQTTETGPVDLTTDFTATGGGSEYSYDQSSNLRVLIRFPESDPDNVASYPSSHTLTVSTENEQVDTWSTNSIGGRSITSFLASDSNNTEVNLTFSGTTPENNIITFGNGSSDSAFSVSTWVKLANPYTVTGDRYLFGKGRTSDATDSEYYAYYKPSSAGVHPNSLTLELRDDSNSYIIKRRVSNANLEDGDWHHIIMTYDGGGGADPATEFKFYLDGDELTTTAVVTNNSSGYVAMEPISEEFHIGASRSGDTEIDGDMAEFAIWGTELTSNHVKAIYYAQYDLISETITYNSGYTDLSPRIKIRDMDNRPGCYPTKHRMGDRDRSGKNNIFYEDLPIQFGDSIKDDFTKVPTADLITYESGFDGNKWVVSTGMTIRREAQIGAEGVEIIDRSATFSGAGTGGKRFLRTSKAIRNITRMYFELIQGPYNQGAILLDLRKGNSTETLKLQISTDSSFTSPTTIATYTPDAAFGEFYGQDYDVNTPPRKRITLHAEDFPDPGQAYYLRFVQETFDSNSKKVWAIPVIEIYYANQNIRYPLLLNHATGHNRFVSASISTPHTDSDLSGVGRAVKGISDIANPFQDFSETITAFDETLTQDITDQFFRSQGVNPSVYPGFSSPVKSKTKFTIDLSPSEETTFGMTNPLDTTEALASTDTSEKGSQLMVYWNNILKKWEKRGQPVRGFNSNDTSFANYATILTGACVGFSGVTLLGTASNSTGDDFSFLSKDQLALSNQMIDQFNFPFGAQYYATSSQTIKASDLGITKPFLLEKIVLDSETKIEVPGSTNHSLSFAYTHPNFLRGDSTKSLTSQFSRIKIVTPTFFIMRQFKDNYEKEVYIQSGSNEQYKYNISLPTASYLNEGDNSTFYVEENREIITFGQNAFFITASAGSSNGISTTIISKEPGEFVSSGLPYDNLSVVNISDMRDDLSLTQSFSIKSDSKLVSKYPLSYSTRYYRPGGEIFQLIYGKDSTSRSDGGIKSGRAIVNGFSSIKPGENIIIPGEKGTVPKQTKTGTDSETLVLNSPYLILPNDDLILGWQYPFPNQIADFGKGADPGTDSVAFNSMTLFGKSKLQLYGSEVVENKEYHETVNQNLTSCAVYEHVIGDEKVVDQWQVAYRGELTGSIIGQTNFGVPGMSIHVPLSTTYTYAYSPDFVTNNLSDFVNNESTAYRVNDLDDLRKGGPVPRIGLFTFTPSKGLQSFDDIPGISTANAKIYYSFAKSSEKHLRFRDQDRIYEDSRILVGNYYDDSSYGTLIRTHDLADTSQNIFKDLRPKYRFNYKHFGQFADMFQQGKDSKVISSGPVNDGVEANFDPPVALTQGLFVSGSFTALGVKTYTKKQTEFFLDFFYFQSSNLNQFMTSSIPFIDDDTPRNRTYITREFIAFNAETTTLGS
jgi:hypothetical protein